MGPRRLPVYLVIDCSSFVRGEPLDQSRRWIEALLADLRSDPMSLETTHISLITFADDAQQITELAPLEEFRLPLMSPSGASALGAALRLLKECIEREVLKPTATLKGDWKPLIFLVTLGHATDEWREAAECLKAPQFGNILVCIPSGPMNRAVLDSLPGSHCELAGLGGKELELRGHFKWCSSPE